MPFQRARLFVLVAILLMCSAVYAQDTATPSASPVPNTAAPSATNTATPTNTATATATALPTNTATPTATPTTPPTALTAAASRVAAPLLEALLRDSATNVALTVETVGSTEALARLCQNTTQLAVTTRSITLEEDAVCRAAAVSYDEYLLGYSAIAFVGGPTSVYNQCLTTQELSTIFAPSASGAINNWTQVNPLNADGALRVLAPAVDTANYVLLDRLITGEGLRSDLTVATDAEVQAAILADPSAIGVMSLQAALAGGTNVRILQVNQGAGCTIPSADLIAQGAYSAADKVLLYVNRTARDLPSVLDALRFATTAAGTLSAQTAGFVAPDAAAYTVNQGLLDGTAQGRGFSTDLSVFQIPIGVAGQVRMGGSAHMFNYVQSVGTALQTLNPSFSTDVKVEGLTAGFRRFCNGETTVMLTDRPLPADVQANCDANNISTYTINLGAQATVFVGNQADTFAQCLRYDQLRTIWNESGAQFVVDVLPTIMPTIDPAATLDPAATPLPPTVEPTTVEPTAAPTAVGTAEVVPTAQPGTQNWNQLGGPDLQLITLAPSAGNTFVDLMMSRINSASLPLRRDVTETRDDALYRAAAVANVPGAITLMSWADYQRVVENNQERIQLLSVDAGNGCITPSLQTITDGTYPLMRPAVLLVNRLVGLTDIATQSFLWFAISDENYGLITNAGFVGLTEAQLAPMREALQAAFDQATLDRAAAAQAVPTAMPTGDAAVATAVATAEATPAP